MYECKNHLAEAEALVKQGSWADAEAFYIAACESAADYFRHWHSDAETIEITVHCYHRLANCCLVQGRLDAALSVCEKIHQMILTSLGEPIATQARLDALLRASKKTTLELQNLVEKLALMERLNLATDCKTLTFAQDSKVS